MAEAAVVLRQDPPGWNPPGDWQLCTCGDEKILHGNGVHWTSCQVLDCDCSKFVVESMSPEAKVAFRREMDAGERCRACGQSAHTTEEHYRPVYGGPVVDDEPDPEPVQVWVCDPPALGVRFRVVRDEWLEDDSVRRILEIEVVE